MYLVMAALVDHAYIMCQSELSNRTVFIALSVLARDSGFLVLSAIVTRTLRNT